MSILLELLFELLLELILQFGFRLLAEPFQKRRIQSPILAGIGSCLLGCIAGFFSLLIYDGHFLHSPTLRLANLVITPPLAGLLIASIGRLRERRGKSTMRLDTFIHGFLFALTMVLVRLLILG